MPYTEAGGSISLPPNQQWLLDFFTILGYGTGHINKKIGDAPYHGLCCGIGHLGVPAILGGDIEPFKQRFYRIYILLNKLKENRLSLDEELDLFHIFPDCQYGLQEARNYIKFLSTLNEALPPGNNNSLRDIQAFCDNVALYQFTPLFEKIVGTSRCWTEMIPFLFSPKIENLGGIEKPIEDFEKHFTEPDLICYFKTLRTFLENATPLAIQQPISLVLSSIKPDNNGLHTVNVGFHGGKWRLIDANNLELLDAEFESDEQIASQVMFSLGRNVQQFWNGKLTMLTETYVAGNACATFAPVLANWKSDIMTAALDIDAFVASLLNTELPVQHTDTNTDIGFQPVIFEFTQTPENLPVKATENSSMSEVIIVHPIEREIASNSSEIVYPSYDLTQDDQEETFSELLRSELLSPIDEAREEEASFSKATKHKRKGDTAEKERAEEEKEFSARKRRPVYEDAGTYRFFASSTQEDDRCTSSICMNYDYQCQQDIGN